MFENMEWGPIISALGAIITALLGWLATWIVKRSKEATEQSKREAALLRLGVIVTGMAQRAWTALSPVMQKALADGKVSAEERAEIEAIVKNLISDFTSQDDLKAIAEALGMPLAGIFAFVASKLIEMFTQAHDPAVPTVSRLTFPVAQPGADGTP